MGTQVRFSLIIPFNIQTVFLYSHFYSMVFNFRCQTYEGGFGGVPGMEAHGGYSFCGLAALMLMGKGHLCDTASLLRWAANRQMRLEGGFQVQISWSFLFLYTIFFRSSNGASRRSEFVF